MPKLSFYLSSTPSVLSNARGVEDEEAHLNQKREWQQQQLRSSAHSEAAQSSSIAKIAQLHQRRFKNQAPE